MVDNPAIHELNNIEVRGGDTDFQVVNIAGSSEDILLEYNDDTDEWDIRGTVSDLDVADLEYEFGLHQTEINEDREIPEGQGSVIAGPLTGTGEITGEGNLAVVDDVQDAVKNPVQENVDFNSNDATGISALEAESVNTDEADISNSPVLISSDGWSWGFDGSNPDERLDNALSEADVGDKIMLEKIVYESDRTISTDKIKISGPSGRGSSFADPAIDANWTIESRGVTIESIAFRDGNQINVNGRDFSYWHSRANIDIVVDNDEASFVGLLRTDIEFLTDTSLGIVDACQAVDVTDNGNNTVGDIA